MNLSGLTRPTTLIVLVVVLVLLFGAKRLPDAARSLGRSLRIMKAETRGLVGEDRSEDLDEKADAQSGREPLSRQTGTGSGSGARAHSGRRDREDRNGEDRNGSISADESTSGEWASGDAVSGEVVDPPQRARER